jgi:hypothetical protein
METKTTISNSEKTNYWEDLLKDSYEVHKIEESNALGKGKRSRKQVLLYFLSTIFWKAHLLVIIEELNLLGMRLYVSLTASLEPIWLKIKFKSINSKAYVFGINLVQVELNLLQVTFVFKWVVQDFLFACSFFFFPVTVKGIRVKLQKKNSFRRKYNRGMVWDPSMQKYLILLGQNSNVIRV